MDYARRLLAGVVRARDAVTAASLTIALTVVAAQAQVTDSLSHRSRPDEPLSFQNRRTRGSSNARLGKGRVRRGAYWNGHLYILPSNENLLAFCLDRGQLSRPPAWRSATRFGNPGATPAVSANGSRDGIVWVIRTRGWREGDRPAALYAWDATNLPNELYNSEDHSARDGAGRAIRFAIPTIANGRVYVVARSEVDVYGLLDSLRARPSFK